MNFPKFFISCDWGTSNFRLRLVESSSLEVMLEHKTNQGIKHVYQEYLSQEGVSQTQFFANYLKAQVQNLPEEHQKNQIILAGMASSNIGLYELVYADLPIEESGGNLISRNISLENGLNIILISGVKSQTGVMRGEETQAIGLVEDLKPYDKGILLLPGTHSKHLYYTNGYFTDFKNYMTGELFELLSQKSILANSVTQSPWDDAKQESFKAGLRLGLEKKLSSSLFSVRTKYLLENTAKEDNYYYLSGMLIGDEISDLQYEDQPIFMAASKPLFNMYSMALELITAPQQLILLDSNQLEKAFLKGQKKILTLNYA